MEEEYFFECPYCDQELAVIVDLTQEYGSFEYECDVCYNPITIEYWASDGELDDFNAEEST